MKIKLPHTSAVCGTFISLDCHCNRVIADCAFEIGMRWLLNLQRAGAIRSSDAKGMCPAHHGPIKPPLDPG